MPPPTYLPPIQSRIYSILEDGCLHTQDELIACIDVLATSDNLKPHLSTLRRTLERHGVSVCSIRPNGKVLYMLARLTYSPNDGRT
jgi:hypothetical protein